jgi:hypothetical protein
MGTLIGRGIAGVHLLECTFGICNIDHLVHKKYMLSSKEGHLGHIPFLLLQRT